MLEALAEGSGELLEEENQGDFPTWFLETQPNIRDHSGNGFHIFFQVT
jgi:hypothetical protein